MRRSFDEKLRALEERKKNDQLGGKLIIISYASEVF